MIRFPLAPSTKCGFNQGFDDARSFAPFLSRSANRNFGGVGDSDSGIDWKRRQKKVETKLAELEQDKADGAYGDCDVADSPFEDRHGAID